MFTEIEHLIKEMIENIDKIKQNRETNISAVKEQKRIIEIEIQELRTKINTHLDKLQEDMLTITMIFQIENSAAGTLMFFAV
jgi:predicted  nucleic acid-binding Zn-ribbon protein